MTAADVKPGLVFQHARYLDSSWKPGPGQSYRDAPPAVCRVTAVRQGRVYYGFGPDARKGKLYTTVEKFLASGHGFNGNPPTGKVLVCRSCGETSPPFHGWAFSKPGVVGGCSGSMHDWKLEVKAP